jgi:SOS response regulatory protein OraA/RecX
MAKISLKNIVGKKNETTFVISNLIDILKATAWIEDENAATSTILTIHLFLL